MALTQWQTLLQQCLLKRISPDELVGLLRRKQETNGKALFKVLIDCRQSFCPPGDPLPPRYLEALLLSHLVALSDALLVFISQWNASTPKRIASTALAALDETIMLTMSPRFTLDNNEATTCLWLSSKWLIAIVTSINRHPAQVDAGLTHLLESCASCLATISATNAGISVLSQKRKLTATPNKTDLLDSVAQAVELAIGLFPAISAQLMDRLAVIQKHIALFTQPEHQPNAVQEGDIQTLQFQANVAESQMMASRAGTLLYLEAVLYAGKTIDDTTLFNFLEGRHSNDYNAMFLDALFASFQLLQKSLAQSQPCQTQTRIFIRNKLPSTLSTIASSPFATFTADQAISDAWSDLSPQLSTPELAACGQHFLHVCSLMQLITDDKRNILIGDETHPLFSKNLHSKDDVIAEVNNGHTRPTNLLNQLVETDGSAAAIAQAIVEIIMTYCQNKETHHLKDLANAMVRIPEAINALALFIKPSYWLSPLCSLLDEWRWDEIHGESQPLYDEFGSILLLILVSKRRLSLTKSEIGFTNQSGFVSRYLSQEDTEQALQDLSEDSQKHLGEWINALYIAESLPDELTTSCSPQEFYLFVPTLLKQSLLAVQAGQLGQETFKGGLEFLLEPFLLPSLVSAISWLDSTSDSAARPSMFPVFSKPPENKEARSIHQTIIDMTSSLASFSFNGTQVFDVDSFQRDTINWVRNVGPDSNLPANFQTFLERRGLDVGLRLVLDIILHFSGTANFLTALDVSSTLVCVADRQLRDLLRLKYTTLAVLLNKNQTLVAEAVVHLHRRVEAYASVLMAQDMGIDQFATLQLSNIDAVAANMDISVPPGTQDMPDEAMDDIDQVLNESAAMSGLDHQVDPAGLNMDDFYGLQGDMGDLDDIDLQMFT